MKWLARLKQIDTAPEAEATEPTKPGFVGFVAPIWAPVQKTVGDSPAANDPTPDPDRWCWPSSEAMTGQEIHTFTARLSRFTDKGLSLDDGEALADKLVTRDREAEDRRLCLECQYLAGQAAASWRCRNWQRAGVAIQSRDAGIPGELVIQLQHCDGFKAVTT